MTQGLEWILPFRIQIASGPPGVFHQLCSARKTVHGGIPFEGNEALNFQMGWTASFVGSTLKFGP